MAGVLCSMVGATFAVAAVAEVIRAKRGITAVGNAQVDTAQSKFGGASALFDGSGDYLIGQSTLISGTGDFTIEMQVRFNSTGAAVLYDQRTFNSGVYTQESPVLFWENSRVIYYNGNNRITSAQTLSTGVWYHLAISKSSGVSKLFIDGTQTSSDYNDTHNNPATGIFGIGINFPGLFTSFNGWIDEIRVSRSARYTANFTAPTAPFVNDANTLLLVHCDGTDASTFFEDDNGVRAKRGLSAFGNAQISTAQQRFGNTSLLSDGTGDGLLITGVTTTSEWTMECWFRTTSVSGERLFFVVTDASDNFIATGGLLNANLYTFAGGTTTGGTVTTNTWNHFVWSSQGGQLALFLNGVNVGTRGTVGALTNAKILIGSTAANRSIVGNMDEIRISNGVRYPNNFTPFPAPFVNDANTILLCHCEGTNASTVFTDDNGVIGRQQKIVTQVGNAQVSTAQSQFGGASALFDGNGDRLMVADDNLLFWNRQPYTVEYWCRIIARTTEPFDTPVIIGNTNPSGQENFWNFGPDNSGNLTFYYFNGSAISVKDSATMNLDQWYHCAAVITSNTIKIYLDGVEKASAAISGTPQFNTGYGGLNIGWGNGTTRTYNGYLDEVRVSNSARYTSNFTPSTASFVNDANTVLLLHMDGANASTQFIDDSGSRSQQGVFALGNAQISTAQSQFGGSSALFDGTGDWLQYSSSTLGLTRSNNFTLEGWVRLSSLPGTNTFRMIYGGSFNSEYASIVNLSGTYASNLVIYDGSNFFETNYTLPSLATNTWYHWAVVKNGTSIKHFWNGVELTTLLSSTGTMSSAMGFGTLSYIGRWQGSTANMWIGNLDEMRISSNVRYTATFTPSTTPFQNDANTLLLLHMDGTNATTVFTDDNGVSPTHNYS
jgi:hypothetical protein